MVESTANVPCLSGTNSSKTSAAVIYNECTRLDVDFFKTLGCRHSCSARLYKQCFQATMSPAANVNPARVSRPSHPRILLLLGTLDKRSMGCCRPGKPTSVMV